MKTVPSTAIHRVVADPMDGATDVQVDVYLRVRRAVMVEGMSIREASRVFGLHRDNDYSVPVAYGHRDVLVRGYVDRVVISCGSEVIAHHPRSYERDDFL